MAEFLINFILFCLFFCFPIFVAIKANNNGYKKWALATIFSIFIGLGLFIGLLAFFKTKNPSGNISINDIYTPPSCSSFNGIGTKFLGASDRLPDGSFVTTQWFTFIELPLFPIRSDRVKYVGKETTERNISSIKEKVYYNIVGPANLDMGLIIKIYGSFALVLLLTIITKYPYLILGYWILFMIGMVFKAK